MALPVYLISIGYIVKAVTALAVELWMGASAFAGEVTIHDDIDRHNHQQDRDSTHYAVPTSGYPYTAIVAEDESENDQDPELIHFPGIISARRRVEGSQFKLRRRYCQYWKGFKLLMLSTQLAIDVIQVQQSSIESKWGRYQCYTQVFANSPNVGSLWILWTFETLHCSRTHQKSPWKHFWVRFFAFSGISMLLAPFLTHVLPFIIAYIWVFLVMAGIGVLTIVAIGKAMESFVGLNSQQYLPNLILGSSVSIGLAVIVSFALGTSVMSHFYSGDSYIRSLRSAVTERETERFLTYVSPMKWFSFVHYFV